MNDITNFQQIFDESFGEAWDRFKDLLPAGGNLLKCTPRDALTIIENKSKMLALTEIIKELVLMNKATQQATVKVIEEIYETCGGPHHYYECLATGGNTFDACASVGTYNQGGNYQAPNNQGFNQQKGQNFNQGNNNYQSPNYQAPNNQAQVRPSNELSNYMKSNEATLRAMQTQMSNMKSELRNEFKSCLETKTNKVENQNNQIMNMLTNLTLQRQSPSGLGSLPSNIVANPRGDVKAITTRSGVAYERPSIPPTSSSLPKEVKRESKATKDKVQTTSSGSIAHVQPPVFQVPILEPEVVPKPNLKPSIPYPSRLNNQKLQEKTNYQMLKLLLSKLIPTCMTLELANRLIAYPVGVAEDIFVKVGKFLFLANFVIVDYDVDPQVLLILGRPFLRTARALIDVHREELTLRVRSPRINMDPFEEFQDSDSNMGFVNFKPYIDSHSPFNIMSRAAYNSVVKQELVYAGNNIVGMANNLYLFVGCHNFLIEFIIFENVNEFIERGLMKVLFGKPFKENIGLEEDINKRVLWFKIKDDKTIFNMPRAERKTRNNMSIGARDVGFDVENKQKKNPKSNYDVTTPRELRRNQIKEEISHHRSYGVTASSQLRHNLPR
nr:reverse transcriptase domain-containing protein [Tanacetum cinerariifolium]